METPEIEKELEELETRGERLRALYEQYFMGLEKIEPQIQRKDMERRIHLLRKEQIRNTGLRFRFHMMVQRFNTMQQYWGRITREIENGTYRRDVVRAAMKFGSKEALTVVGRKRAAQYEKLVAAQQERLGRQQSKQDEEYEELDDADVDDISDGEGEIDEVPTPPRFDNPATPPPSARVAVSRAPHQAWDIMAEPTQPPDTDWNGGSNPADEYTGDGRSGQTPAPYVRQPATTGLRLGGSRPRTPTRDGIETPSGVRVAPDPDATKRRLAELASKVPTSTRERSEPAQFGALDLDFDGGDSEPQRPAVAKPAPSAPVRPPPQADGNLFPPPPAAIAREAPKPAAPKPPARQAKFGEIALTDDVLAPTPSSAAPPPPPPQQKPPEQPIPPPAPLPKPSAPQQHAPPVARPRPEPSRPEPAAARSEGGMPDQRLRQIYAKYLEMKRSQNESTAGVTFDKLATSLRQQTEKLRAAHPTRQVDYEVVFKDGKTILKPVLK